MIVMVDANAVVSDPYLRSDTWRQLQGAVSSGRVTVVTPEIALEEAISLHKKYLKNIGRKLWEDALRAPRAVKEIVEEAKNQTQRMATEYESSLKKIWFENKFIVAKTAEVSHLTLARRAMGRRRPFNDQGNGYRDTLHWLTLLELASRSPDQDVVLISGDGIFSNKQGNLLQVLREEFSEVSNGSILLCKELSKLEVPGHYLSEPVPASQYEEPLRQQLLRELDDEYALRKMRTYGVHAPSSDWDELLSVDNLNFVEITSRDVYNQERPDIHFAATAEFTVRGTYINDIDDRAIPEFTTHDVRMPVEITGNATVLQSGGISSVRDLDARHVGDDLMLVDEVRRAGAAGLASRTRAELVQHFGESSVSRVEARVRLGEI